MNLFNLLTISILLSVLCLALGSHTPKINATALDGFPDDLDIQPYTKIGQKLYHFGQTKATWFNANLICRAMGGYLASIESQQEMTQLSDYIKCHFPKDRWWWLSGSDLNDQGQFHWYGTGEPFKYTNWSPDQPDNAGGVEHCVHLWFGTKFSQYKMNDWKCTEMAYYICEANRPTTVLLTVF